MQVVSGVWHGIFPGYFLFFVSSAFMFESSKILYRYEQVRVRCIQSHEQMILQTRSLKAEGLFDSSHAQTCSMIA